MAATRRQCGSSVGSFGLAALPGSADRALGQGLCVIVRKPDPTLLVLSPAVGPQARDLPPPTP